MRDEPLAVAQRRHHVEGDDTGRVAGEDALDVSRAKGSHKGFDRLTDFCFFFGSWDSATRIGCTLAILKLPC